MYYNYNSLLNVLNSAYMSYVQAQMNNSGNICGPMQQNPVFQQPIPQQLCTPYVQNTAAPADNKAAAVNAPAAARVKPAQTIKAPKVQHSLKAESFTSESLTEDNLDKIIAMYGIDIKDIYDLGPGQLWMFSAAKVVTSTFFTQTLFKAVAKINPSAFRQNMDKVIDKHDNLRTAFAHTDLEKPYQVVFNSRQADVTFQDISSTPEDELDDLLKRLMASDRRKGFDLEKDVLLRISVYKTGEETCAILVSQPHINIDGVSSGILYKELFIDYAMQLSGSEIDDSLPDVAYKSYIDWLTTLDKSKEFDYWKKVLADLPKLTVIPGYQKSTLEFVQSTSALEFDVEFTKKIRGLQKSCKATLNNIVQTAWGIMIQKIYGIDDVTFGAITSGRSAEVKGSGMIMGGMVNAVPVRVKDAAEIPFKKLVLSQQKQFAQSLENSHCSPFEIQAELNRDEPIFDHLLNFHNFSGADNFTQAPQIPGITLMGSESFDNLASDLCVYFGTVRGMFTASFTYNKNAFTLKKITLLQECFKKVMEQICEKSDILIKDIVTDTIEVFMQAGREADAEKKNIVSFMKKIKIFSILDEAVLEKLAEHVQTENYMVDDIIIKEKRALNKVSFVMDGYVELSRVSTEGWLNSVRILKPGDMLAAEGIIEGKKTYGAVTAASANVTLLSIPSEVMIDFMKEHPETAIKLIDILNDQVRAMTSLWINADQGN